MAVAAVDRLAPGLVQDVRLGRYARSLILPRESGVKEYYVPTHVIGHKGFDLCIEEQLARVRNWRAERYQTLFRKLRESTSINTGRSGQSFGTAAVHNGYYPTPDAEIYAAMILDARPAQIVEVGSGYSTLIARTAIDDAGLPTKLTVIDPEPRTDVGAACDEIIRKCVEDSDLAGRAWKPNSILFIDSSHICRTGGDLPRLFCEIVPNLPPDVIVHVHDVFLPYDYPSNYNEYCYTEQYLLHCLLSGANRYRTMLSTHYLSRNHSDQMQAAFGEKPGRDPLFNGASYWFKVVS
jgi:Methyltransferase domain